MKKSTFKLHRHEPLRFPRNFIWGTSTSAHQIEGGNKNNDWWQWEKNPRHIWSGQRSGRAAFSYEHYGEDAKLASELNCNSYRLSVEWSRVQPEAGQINLEAIEYYRSVLQTYRARGIKIMVTLHHFTNPQWFAARGGWMRRDAPKIFADYVQQVVAALGDLVDWWITINEPSVYAGLGFYRGTWPPGQKSRIKSIWVLRQLMRAHRMAYKKIHEQLDRPGKKSVVGVAMNMMSFSSYEHGIIDLFILRILEWVSNHSFLFFTRSTHDFIGVNYYFHQRVGRHHGFWLGMGDRLQAEQRETSDVGWEVYPQGIYEVLNDVWRAYHLPVIITENGIATENEDRRARFIVANLKEVYHAIKSGVDVRGYFYWSLIDNFEWEKGFAPRFGLVRVNFKTGERTVKDSARVFATIAAENGISHYLLSFLGHGVSVAQVFSKVWSCRHE